MTFHNQKDRETTASTLELEPSGTSLTDWQRHHLERYQLDADRILQYLVAGRGSDFLVERAMNLLINYLSLPRHLLTNDYTHEVMIQLATALYSHFWPQGYWHLISRWWPPLIELAQDLPNSILKMFLIVQYSFIRCNQGPVREGLALCEPLIYSRDFARLPSAEQANILHHVGAWYVWLGEYERAVELISQCLKTSEEYHHWEYQSFALNILGSAAMFQGNFKQARTYYEQCLAVLLEHDGEDELACVAYQSLGRLLIFQKRFTEAIPWMEKGLAVRRRWGEREGIAVNAAYLARAYLACGRLAEAEALIDEALSISKTLEYPVGIMLCHLSFALLEEKLNPYTQAIIHYRQALALMEKESFPPEELRVLLHFLPLLLRRGQLWDLGATLPRLWRSVRMQRLGLKALWRLWRGK